MLSRRLSPTVATLVPPEAAPGSHTTTVTGVPSEAPAGALTALCASPPTIAITLVSPQASAGKLTDRWSPQAWCVARFSQPAAGKLRTLGSSHTLVRSFILTCLVSLVPLGLFSTSALATVCPNEAIRLQEGDAAALPDCRAYEQVSPVDKNLNDAVGVIGLMQSSPSGERVSYVSLSPFAGISGAAEFPTYVSTRRVGVGGAGEWSTQGVLPRTKAGTTATPGVFVQAFTEDLSEALVTTSGSSASQFLFVSDGSLFVPFPPVERFSGASADDSDILFESEEALESEGVPVAGARAGVPNLYEWDDGRLLLVGVPEEGEDGTPKGGATAGPDHKKGLQNNYYTQGSISEDGSRVLFTAVESGRIYMREPLAVTTMKVSGLGPAEWLASTPSGSEVFYTEGVDHDLYRFGAESQTRERLTQDAGIQGMLGISSDGSYAYFVAQGVLAGENAEGNRPVAGAENLYEWHEGATIPITYVADLRGGGRGDTDESDWRGWIAYGAGSFEAGEGEKSSGVTPDGETVMFSSIGPLTAYDNGGVHELYLYDAENARITCVSCNPLGPATTGAYLARKGENGTYPVSRAPFLTRNLSSDGRRVFFQTEEALVAKDSNGLSDVYEWEEGHLYLISSGQGNAEGYFADASADGDDVFFFTRQPLVSEDQDDNADVYDARVDGGIAAQNPVIVPPCIGEECHGQTAPPPVFSTPSSVSYAGPGNVAPEPAAKPKAKPKAKAKACKKGSVRKHGKCVKRAKAKRR